MSEAHSGLPTGGRRSLVAGHLGGLALLGAVIAWGVGSDVYVIFLLTVVMAYTIAAAGLNLLFGLSGGVSMGHGAIFGAGAYATGWLVLNTSMPLWSVFALIAVGFVVVGGVLVIPTLRVSGLFLAMVTLAYALLFNVVILNWDGVTGGPLGLSIFPPERTLPTPRNLFLFAAVVAAAAVWITWRLRASSLGRGWRALKDSEASASVLGIPVVRYKVIAFVLSAIFAGIGGYFYALAVGYLSPTEYDVMLSVDFLVVLIVGGAGRVLGPLLGSLLVVLAPEYLGFIGEYEPLIVGILLLLFLTFARGGISGFVSAVARRVRPRPQAGGTGHQAPPVPIETAVEVTEHA
ncbi:MAG: branched-chain amino acid ABC transporter permease [Actinomycetota bacterium]